ncbi:MAG: hypothetical protein KatS3mg019_1951 [Fimbriimonadales bacterium]|nr:MAG: hypothetical protein KatS3mg019_1951 [Fimbriimonadales bacterium]
MKRLILYLALGGLFIGSVCGTRPKGRVGIETAQGVNNRC